MVQELGDHRQRHAGTASRWGTASASATGHRVVYCLSPETISQPQGGVMRLTKFGHSCLLVEEGPARMLLDPGTLSGGFEEVEGLTAVLVTHQHADHLDAGRLMGLLDRNPGVRVVSDEGAAGPLGEAGAEVEVVHDGEELDIGGVGVRVAGRDHAVIHPDIPVIPNVGYLVGGRLFHPGDAFTLPGQPVEVLAVPAGAPWLKVSEAIDYLRRVRPKVAVPVHDQVLSTAGRSIHYRQLEQLGTGGSTTLRVLDDGKPVAL
jgi:L-ascorbate metabolism protein UlaG (beta-lactamase superfamily)